MKKVIFVAALPLLLFSCSGKEGHSEQAKKNLETMNAIIDAIEAKDLNKLDQYMAADVVDHTAMNGPATGIENVKKDLEAQLQMSSDMKSEVIKELADDEYVMSWLRFKGTASVDMMGMKKGEAFESTTIEVAKFNKDNKVTDHWVFMSPAEMMKMMQGMNSMPPADTSKNAMPDSTGK